jgi:broad specificity phosphatase PhoE
MKNIYCIRHGLALHNVLGQEIGSKAYFLEKCFDAPLVDKGILQAKELGKKWDNLDKIQKVFVSPLTRTLQTTENIFKDKIGLKIIALDGIKEFPQGMETCNKRREKKELEMNFKNIDFSELDSDTDQMWREDRFETIEELEQRIEDFKNLLKKLDDENVAVVSHSSFLKQMLYGTIGDDSNQLNHCHPYKFDISK